MFRLLKRTLSTTTRFRSYKMTQKQPISLSKIYGISKTGTEMKIVLNEKEWQICNALKGVSKIIANERPELPLIESRIAGGWVRDKLLGKECNDIDIAINDMMGVEFATYVNKYLQKQGVPTRSIAKISSNPEKSKHLETATTRLFGQEVDFCNLRTEIYEEGSRIPSKVTFGTPTEDAYRRDITINSLFYNVNQNTVEDFTNKGIPDLIEGKIRTPLKPFETFQDDPLRVIRCIRFASRFNFQMVPELIEAAKHPDIKDALIHKISRERIGIEFEKMITGPYPLLSLRLIHDLELYPIMFTAPLITSGGDVGEPKDAVNAVGIATWLIQNKHDTLLQTTTTHEERDLILASSLLPYYGLMSEFKARPILSVQPVLKEAIKANNHDVKTVTTLFKGIERIKILAQQSTKPSRTDLGMLIRDMGILWKTGVKMAIVTQLLADYPLLNWQDPTSIEANVGEEVLSKHKRLIELVHEYGIEECWTWKHLVDGNTAAAVVGIKPGPAVSELLKFQMCWQLENPNGTKQECEQAIKTFWDSKQ